MAANHVIYLGKLLGNLQSLETVLRFFLLRSAAKKRAQPFALPARPFVVGATVPEDEFTNYDTLSELIRKFNAEVMSLDPSLAVDSGIVSVRDLLAHGRVSADSADENRLEIVKFDRPRNGQVTVIAAATMDEAWFTTNLELVRKQLERVHKAMSRAA